MCQFNPSQLIENNSGFPDAGYVAEPLSDYTRESRTWPSADEAARRIIEHTGISLFLTGKAGTGKTTFLRCLREESKKHIVVLAPTGVAAINAGGNTIHSFFQLDFGPYIPGSVSTPSGSGRRFSREKIRVIKSFDLLVIDEVSMVRPDVLDAVDAVLRRFRNPIRPFGGVQLLLIGDLRQLAPVAQENEWKFLSPYYNSPYFFESRALKQLGYLMVELTTVYRQSDEKFISILNKIRENRADSNTLSTLNRRANPSLLPALGQDEGYIRLTTHNYRADSINAMRIAQLPSQPVEFTAQVSGNFPESSYPAEKQLVLKVGAQVMFVKNDPSGNQAFYNGLIGTVVRLTDSVVVVQPRQGPEESRPRSEIKVGRVEWSNSRYELQDSGELKEIIEGRFSQVPLRLAWAITIHKSQGLTFDRAIIDAARSFAPGQTYVALSRCRSMEGLILDSPLSPSAIITDPAVSRYIASQSRLDASDIQIEEFSKSYKFDMLMELFNFANLDNAFDSYYRACVAALPRKYPRFIAKLDDARLNFQKNIVDVASKMQIFLSHAKKQPYTPEVAAIVEDKIKGGSTFFYSHLSDIRTIVDITPLELDNASLLKRLKRSREAFLELLLQKITLFKAFSVRPFETNEYLRVKSLAIAQIFPRPKRKRHSKSG